MKIAISIPDELFGNAESLSKRLGVSRSRLFAIAIEEMVAKHNSQEITDRLNAVYGNVDSKLPEDVRRLQRRSIDREPW